VTFVGLHEIPYFPEIWKKLCPNPELAYTGTGEKEVNCIELAQDWIQWRLL